MRQDRPIILVDFFGNRLLSKTEGLKKVKSVRSVEHLSEKHGEAKRFSTNRDGKDDQKEKGKDKVKKSKPLNDNNQRRKPNMPRKKSRI